MAPRAAAVAGVGAAPMRPRCRRRRNSFRCRPARIARLKRFDTNWQAALARIDAAKLTGVRQGGPRHAEERRQRQPRPARCRDPDDGAGARGGAIRAQARAARRSAHPRRRHGLAASCRHPDRCHQGDCEALGRGAARQSRAGDARRERRRAAARHHDRVVQLLQRLRSAVHLVDGDALRQGGRGPEELRGAPARQGRRREPAGCRDAGDERTDCRRTAAQIRGCSGPRRDHRVAAGRDARRGREIHRCRRWRTRRPGSGWGRAGTRRRFLRRVAGGAEVTRLRQAVAQRAGRLPLHPPHRGNADRARQPQARSQSTAQGRLDRHPGAGARPRGAHPGSVGSDDSVHAGRADRARREGVRVV